MYAEQIKALHKSGASVEDIATGMEISVEEVRTVLIHTSPKFRAAAFVQPDGAQTKDQLAEEMLMIAAGIARGSDMDMVRLSAAKFVRDDIKGRRDIVPIDAGANLAALAELQAGLVLARQRRLDFLKGHNAAIDIGNRSECGDQPNSGNTAQSGEPATEIVPASNAEG